MVDKGCDNCYYTYFDEKAYPCSLCIRGIERTDQWQPSKKTKANTPQTDEPPCMGKPCGICGERNYCKFAERTDTPQTERIKTTDYCDICNHKGCDNCIANNLDDYCVPSGYAPKDTPQTDCGWK